jgi:hypothetical protein
MPLKIIDDGSRHEFKVGSGVIYYSKAGWGELRDIRRECRDPEPPFAWFEDDVDTELLTRHAHGWENVVDAEDKPVPFSLKHLLRLPESLIDGLLIAIRSSARAEEAAVGESESSSTT